MLPGAQCYPEAKNVKLQLTTGNDINMYEFQVMSSGVNIAPNGIASQSFTLPGYPAYLAVDGSAWTFSHTAFQNDTNHATWWELDFNQVHSTQSLTIINRYCRMSDTSVSDLKGCLCGMSGAELFVFENYGSAVWSQTFGDTCGQYV